MRAKIFLRVVAFAAIVSALQLIGHGSAAAGARGDGNTSAASPSSGSNQPGKSCRRVPIWGQRISAFCKPSGICPDRVIKGYKTVCS